MMLRKRASFKPNIQQAPKPVQETPPAPAATTDIPPEKSKDEPAKETGPDPVVIQEAITQLTSQRLEPIKLHVSLKLHNKNVKLRDLLFVNPPMTKDQKRHRKQPNKNKVVVDQDKQQQQQHSQSQSTEQEDEPQASLVPKVKVGPDGQLILDESSTIINRKNLIKDQVAIVEDHEDVISRTNYDSYRRKPIRSSQTKWSSEETKNFYHALSLVGTDFSMMESLLYNGSRTRTELHKKFKREERINKTKIDLAISNTIPVDSQDIDEIKEIFQRS